VLDNTMRSAFVACPTKMYWAHHRHLAPPFDSVHLHAGAAFAKGVEVFRRVYWDPEQGGGFDKALLAGFYALIKAYRYDPDRELTEFWLNSNKTFDRVAAGYVDYWHEYRPEVDYLSPHMMDGKPAVEFNAVLPLEEKHPMTGEPLLYSIRFDMLGEKNDTLFVVDEKTCSQLGPTWSKQWDLRAQFTGYIWGAKQYNLPVNAAIVRGCCLLKTGIKHGQVITYRPDWEIERWYEQLHRDIRRMKQCWQDQHWDLNLSDSCAAFGGCSFVKLCTSNNPEAWIERNYRIQEWDPTLSDEQRLARMLEAA
jgi:hypothetical protein